MDYRGKQSNVSFWKEPGRYNPLGAICGFILAEIHSIPFDYEDRIPVPPGTGAILSTENYSRNFSIARNAYKSPVAIISTIKTVK